jgi:carbonic anhydrase
VSATPTTGRDERIVAVTAQNPEAVAEVARLFAEYSAWLGSFVSRTTIPRELESLPAPFSAPGGMLLVGLAEPGGAICGCVGVMRHSDSAAEIKRLFVRDTCRGSGLGAALFAAALQGARDLGYREALVSTIPSRMAVANAMYDRLGFTPTERFEDHTHADVEIRYLRLAL